MQKFVAVFDSYVSYTSVMVINRKYAVMK